MAFDQNGRSGQDCTAGQDFTANVLAVQSWPKPQKWLKFEKK